MRKIAIFGPLFSLETQIKEEFVISYIVDGASEFLDKIKSIVNCQNYITVGDGDSSSVPMDINFDTNKDFSDLAGTLELIKEDADIYIYGFSGGRLDHDFINYGEFFKYLLAKNNSKFILDKSIIYPKGNWPLKHVGVFSILGLYTSNIKISGNVKFQLEKSLVSPFSSKLLSNEASGEFNVNSDMPFLIYYL